MTPPETAYRSENNTGDKILHVDEDCSALKTATGTIEVATKKHLPLWDWCQFCAADLNGVDPADQPIAEGEMLATKLREADSLEELREGGA
jgi:hypothetical protein